MRPLILGAAFALMVLITGCQTPHTFATPDASWKTHVGQLKHTNRERTVIGEVVVRKRGEEFQLDFLKGGSFPLISVRQDAATSHAEGLLAGGRWQGVPATAPKALRPWLGLREAFAPPPGNLPRTPMLWKGKGNMADGQSRDLDLTFIEDGQRFVFKFGR